MTERSAIVEAQPAWGRHRSLYQPAMPAFWIAVVMFVVGAVVIQARLAPALNRNVEMASLALVLWILYAIPFIVLIKRLDLLEPEPPAFLASAFGWGALAATSVAIVANTATRSIMTELMGPEFTQEWWAALSGPTTEELVKAIGIVLVLIVARQQVDTVLDGLIYGMFIGLGFQVAENLVYTADKLQGPLFSAAPGRLVLEVFLLRGIVLGLWSHAVYTGIMGFGIAYAVVHREAGRGQRVAVLCAAVAAAWFLHFAWNAPFTQPEEPGLQSATIALYVGKGLPAALLILLVIRLARRREAPWISEVLRDDPDVAPNDIEALTSHRRRRQARAAARRRSGPAAARAVAMLQAAQVRLAVACAHPERRGGPAIDAARTEVRAARSLVAGLEGQG